MINRIQAILDESFIFTAACLNWTIIIKTSSCWKNVYENKAAFVNHRWYILCDLKYRCKLKKSKTGKSKQEKN